MAGPMNVLMICTSPNEDGNTARILKEMRNRISEKGDEVRWLGLAGMQVAGCRGCRKCQHDGRCVIRDDMDQIVEGMRWADVVVLGSPVYMGSETGQTKCLIDRMYCLFQGNPDGTGKSRLSPGKRAVTVLTCALRDGDRNYAYENTKFFKVFVNMLGFDFILSSIVPDCRDPQAVLQNRSAVHALSDAMAFLYP